MADQPATVGTSDGWVPGPDGPRPCAPVLLPAPSGGIPGRTACRRDIRLQSANDAKRYTGALSLEVGAPVACPGTEGRSAVRDEIFLIAWGLAMLGGALVYAATGWAPPALIDKRD